MITIKRLNTPQMVEHACALLHEVYIEQQKWVFKPDNPSQIRIESAGDRYILVDRFTSRAIWFGAFDDEKLVGCVRLTIEEGCAKIVVEDSGKGMPAELVRKIKQQVAITQDKDGGHGIGLMQVFETLKRHNGHMDIESVQGTGTQIILTFPLMESPEWITNSIHLNPSDTIVILDDDCDIHEAWDIYFESKLFKENEIKIRHFTEAVDAISFVQSMSTAEREHVFLLTDYELLKQDINGLNVIDRLNPIRAILITGHHENIDLQDQAIERQTKIIPKSLVSQIPITVMER